VAQARKSDIMCCKIMPIGTERNGSETILDLVGNTPLLQLQHVTKGLAPGVSVYGKAEWYNPGGSLKDRPALWIIRDAVQRGVLTPDKVLLDATSGNTGIAYAMFGAVLGYKVELCVPANLSHERRRILTTYGATLINTSPLEGSDGAIREARARFAANPERYFYADQYNNDANWRAHYETTGPEIWRQTGGRVTHFVAALGTSGSFTGTARRLKEYSPEVRVFSVQPDGPFHGLEGMKHMDSAIVPGIYDPGLADANLEVQTEHAQAMARRLAREEGLLLGLSASAAVVAALSVARELEQGVVVTILCDSGMKYLSERFWEESQR
jgi:S-sulfo-L-cysteine synthase (O-acetyl-L-serine-dependent)